MVDKRNMPQFEDRNTQRRTQFWHARKFRDSTSVLKGGMYEDIDTGYFAGAFTGRKFKSNPSAKEFERSLEYLLDDLSASSSCSQSSFNTPSICSSSVTSLDTVVTRDAAGTPESDVSSIRNGFMIDVTITENLRKNRRRPRSDIFEFIQEPTGQGQRSYDKHMLKTKSMCDVSSSDTKAIQPRLEAKQYEMEFENMLDELHSTIEDLDTFSRENIGVSLESLESVSSVSKSGRVSPISTTSDTTSYSYSAGELKISESALSTDSATNSSIYDRPAAQSLLLHMSDSTEASATNFADYRAVSSDASKISTIQPGLSSSESDLSSIHSIKMNGVNCSNSTKSVGYLATEANNQGSFPKKKTRDHLITDNFQFLPDLAKDYRRGADVEYRKSALNGNTGENLQPDSHQNTYKTAPVIAHIKLLPRDNNIPLNTTVATAGDKTSNCLNGCRLNLCKPSTIDLQKYTIKSHYDNHHTGVISGSPQHPQYSENDPNGSIMSSVTDLSGIASEIGYIADMDESVLTETPDYKAPWLDAAIQDNMESGMGDCFIQKGFRPLNFIGVESKYMISPLKGNELRIPTPVKLRKETGTQTCDESRLTPDKDYQSLNSKDNEDKQAGFDAVCTSTQTDNSLQCSCGSTREPLYSPRLTEQGVFCQLEEEARKRKTSIHYCSSVEISPLLNGSQLPHYYCRLARANSLDTGLSSKKKTCNVVSKKYIKSSGNLSEASRMVVGNETTARDRGGLERTIKSQHLEVRRDQCFLTQGQGNATSVKQPEIIVTVPPHKQSKESMAGKEDGAVQIKGSHYKSNKTMKGFLSPRYCHNMCCSSLKSESVPNISYSHCSGQSYQQAENQQKHTQKHQETLRRYASILIISNINKHFQGTKEENGRAIKRSSYERDVTFTQNNNSQKTRKTTHQEPSVAPQETVEIGTDNGSSDENSQTLTNNHRQMMSYTF